MPRKKPSNQESPLESPQIDDLVPAIRRRSHAAVVISMKQISSDHQQIVIDMIGGDMETAYMLCNAATAYTGAKAALDSGEDE